MQIEKVVTVISHHDWLLKPCLRVCRAWVFCQLPCQFCEWLEVFAYIAGISLMALMFTLTMLVVTCLRLSLTMSTMAPEYQFVGWYLNTIRYNPWSPHPSVALPRIFYKNVGIFWFYYHSTRVFHLFLRVP